ncbi:GNAT family N-acetyltransferase [Algirhabdus cladophorae]|uniref:GNAT family N-acetyltransferase n=1 Tax=Algirhabdus cladophorae TaxID=3377108 RepID=UPI003B84ABCB
MIRFATSHDLDAIQRCATAAYEIYVRAMGRKPAPMVADFADLISRNVVWIIPPHGFIVMYPQAGALHVENVAVHPDGQGQGLGQRLMAFAEDHARGLNLSRITLYTNAKMAGPLKLYPRLGYVETDRRVEDGFDRVYFAKLLI